jgi:hypothetical protein
MLAKEVEEVSSSLHFFDNLINTHFIVSHIRLSMLTIEDYELM